ncbi:MAG: glutaredoxin 3 [Candidatus Paceibacteria bacterium]|jgi:glutaredoxin 3
MIIYTKTGCPWCNELKDFLKENKVEFEERNVTESDELRTEMEEKSGQTKAPVVDIEGEIFADTDKDEIEKVLKEKGII